MKGACFFLVGLCKQIYVGDISRAKRGSRHGGHHHCQEGKKKRDGEDSFAAIAEEKKKQQISHMAKHRHERSR